MRKYTDAEKRDLADRRAELRSGRTLRPSHAVPPALLALVRFLNGAAHAHPAYTEADIAEVRDLVARDVAALLAGTYTEGSFGEDIAVKLRIITVTHRIVRRWGRYAVETLAAPDLDPLQYYWWIVCTAVQTGDLWRLRHCPGCGKWRLGVRRRGRYCSARCADAARQAKARDRQRKYGRLTTASVARHA
jgi:hypothetical protein